MEDPVDGKRKRREMQNPVNPNTNLLWNIKNSSRGVQFKGNTLI